MSGGIVIENLTKKFGTFTAVDDVSFEARDGAITALLGPSGSGKSTVLRMIAGLEQPDGGRIWVDGEEHTNKTPQERRLGFVFQHYALFRHMNVRQNVAFGLAVRRASKADQRKRVDELLELVGLGPLAERRPDQLSGGQRQRVALARALAPRPKVLLLDEPFGALDARVRQELRRWLDDLHRELGVTSLLVTHDQEEALELAQQVVVMRQGNVEQIGGSEDIYNRPATPFVAGFVGASNVVKGTVFEGHVHFGRSAVAGADHLLDGAEAAGVHPPARRPAHAPAGRDVVPGAGRAPNQHGLDVQAGAAAGGRADAGGGDPERRAGRDPRRRAGPGQPAQRQGVRAGRRQAAPAGRDPGGRMSVAPPAERRDLPMRISARTDYALRAVARAGRGGEGRLVKAEDIAHAHGIPLRFLLNILIDLRHAGLVESQRGSVGGYRLARPADSITLAEVIRAMSSSDGHAAQTGVEAPTVRRRRIGVGGAVERRLLVDGDAPGDGHAGRRGRGPGPQPRLIGLFGHDCPFEPGIQGKEASSTRRSPLDTLSMEKPERCEGCEKPLSDVVVMVHTADGWKVFHADCLGVAAAYRGLPTGG